MRSVPIAPVLPVCPLKGKDLFRHAPVLPPHGGIFSAQRCQHGPPARPECQVFDSTDSPAPDER